MITKRRHLLKALLALSIVPHTVLAKLSEPELQSWEQFITAMRQLSRQHQSDKWIAERGMMLMKLLDVQSKDFAREVANAWESGNRFWFWQRLSREPGLLGGVLSIEKGQDIPMHDHPGATGIVRILEGQAEVWQYDVVDRSDPSGHVILKRHLYRRLKPGDTAALLPNEGNIHTLRASTAECRMLDYFIPPYQRLERKWYTPISHQWSEKDTVRCKETPEQEFETT